MEKIIKQKKESSILSRKRKNLIFYCAFMAFPIIQFITFYCVVNVNSILLIFKTYQDGSYIFSGLDNIKEVLNLISTEKMFSDAIKNSCIYTIISLLISTPLGLLFSFYIAKKMRFSEVFRVILFLPSIISSIIIVIVFQNFVDVFLPAIVKMINPQTEFYGFLANEKMTYKTLVFFNIWVSFGSTTLLYSSAMSGISDSVIEASHLDGVNSIQEFWYVTLPMVYSTFSIFVVVTVAGVFSNQLHLYSFYEINAPKSVYTIGYYLYRQASIASAGDYPRLATFGILSSVVCIPLTLFIRWLLAKVGPSVE